MLDNDTFSPQSSTVARLKKWLLMSEVTNKVITNSDFYSPREWLNQTHELTNEHRVHVAENPFSNDVINKVEHYLTGQNTRAFLLWHQGKLVHSNYIDFHPDATFNSMSMVKSLVGLCIGIAIDRKLIVDINEPAYNYLHEWKHDARQHITIDHLLTMQSGLHSDVVISPRRPILPIIPLQMGDDIRKTALSIPAVAPPEQYFVYNNYNSQLLGIILERATGKTFAQCVNDFIWQPLGLGNAFAWTDKKGMARSFGGFFARPIDWLTIATLFATDGNFNGKQIVSKQWLNTMTTPTNTTHRGVKKAHADYGRQIWLESHHYGTIAGIPKIEGLFATRKLVDKDMVYFEGLRGQYCFISKKHQLVMMRMGERPKRNWDASRAINQLIDALEDK